MWCLLAQNAGIYLSCVNTEHDLDNKTLLKTKGGKNQDIELNARENP